RYIGAVALTIGRNVGQGREVADSQIHLGVGPPTLDKGIIVGVSQIVTVPRVPLDIGAGSFGGVRRAFRNTDIGIIPANIIHGRDDAEILARFDQRPKTGGNLIFVIVTIVEIGIMATASERTTQRKPVRNRRVDRHLG